MYKRQAYNWNVMWLDCIFLFPLIALGLEKLVSEGKFKLYVISLGLCILSNYYISIMVCIFLVLYFLLLLVDVYKRQIPLFSPNTGMNTKLCTL